MSGLRRAAGVACAAAMMGAGAAGPAWAGVVSVESGEARFVSVVDQRNVVTISLSQGAYVFHDSGSDMLLGAGCSRVDARTATCPATGIVRLAAHLGGGNDFVENTTATRSSQLGGGGNDVLKGGSGPDEINGEGDLDVIDAGAGDDYMFDGVDLVGFDKPDRFTCGAGRDRVDADLRDVVDADCEVVTRPRTGPDGITPVPGARVPDTGPIAGPCGLPMLGTTGDDSLVGGGDRDEIYGLAGADDLRGIDDDDCMSGGRGADRIAGGKGRDRIAGGKGRDRIAGGKGRDVLTGGGGRNRIGGGTGADVIRSANGRRDVVRCGAGDDRVVADAADRLSGCEAVTRRSA